MLLTRRSHLHLPSESNSFVLHTVSREILQPTRILLGSHSKTLGTRLMGLLESFPDRPTLDELNNLWRLMLDRRRLGAPVVFFKIVMAGHLMQLAAFLVRSY